MSTAMNFGIKSFKPRPPEKGSFPLDHLGECKPFKEIFMKCLRENNFQSNLCREESKEYLECRMERYVLCSRESEDLFGQYYIKLPPSALDFVLHHSSGLCNSSYM
ncbi:hypothetical protein GDO81_016805 [Engystomops pustulosus]|uniref:Cytochrome c oxidase assembly protein COX19 n=1 Tax=Engystomops pustulosus TaxID=76066 RepID=A0AAV7A930_ENGPU|nr:hypothetical protein GDO81_016805 [Engystomops pustulosus]